MTARTLVSAPRMGTAQWAVDVDGVFCVLSGLTFLLDANAVGQFMGAQPSVIAALGLGVFLYGVGLLYDVFKGKVNARMLKVVIGLDVVWVVASVLLLVAAPTALTTEGRWTVLILADIVGAFAIWQYVGLRRLAR